MSPIPSTPGFSDNGRGRLWRNTEFRSDWPNLKRSPAAAIARGFFDKAESDELAEELAERPRARFGTFLDNENIAGEIAAKLNREFIGVVAPVLVETINEGFSLGAEEAANVARLASAVAGLIAAGLAQRAVDHLKERGVPRS